MALFDKLGELARNVGDKTSDLLEINRLSGKVRGEENAVAELKKELGQYFYEKYLNGEKLDEAAEEHCRNIQAGEETVADLYAQIQKIKEENAKAEPEEAAVCANCGAQLKPDANYCQACGAKVGAAAKLFCPQCGAEIDEESRFCSSCGVKIKED